MSTSLAHAARLKPEIRLAQAVSRFEADLSNNQKSALRTSNSKLLNSPPGTSDVMRLTAEMDRQMSTKLGGRCIGPRFTNFLHGVQQFAALGDVVVGGSQNIIACGVWSLVRMSLLAIVSFPSYLEKLSNLFMDIGRSAPRYQTMALLYPKSKSLQSLLLEYFIVVVNLCRHLLHFTQKSVLQQVASTLSDLDLKNFQMDLDRWANSIKEEMNLTDAQENSQFRALSSKRSKYVSHQQKLTTNLRVLDFCSKYDHETSWKQTRKVGRSTLFTQLAEYQEWKISLNSCTLLCTGKLGSGKSVLLANIVDDLSIYAGNDETVVTYFFCRHDITESLRARTILGSLARQLLRTISDLSMVADVCKETFSTEDTKKVLELLFRGFPPDRKVYFILDGLDECNYVDREALIHEFQEIQKTFKVLLCISIRVEPNNRLETIAKRFVDIRVASIPDDNPDIKAFIDAELERCLQSRRLVIGDPTLILQIHDALLKGSQGMFLWVALQIQSLCSMETDQAIQDALADLPKDLSETFSRILRKSGQSGQPGQSRQSYQRRIIELVLAAYRPLTVDELREALSVVPGDNVWTASRSLNNIYSVLACCGSLIIVDEEEFTVRFVHHSVKQFILNEFKDAKNMAFTAEWAQRTIADIVVTYLSYSVFGSELSKRKISPVMIESTPSTVIGATIGSSSSTVQSLALRLLKSRKQPRFDISKTLAEARKAVQPLSVDQFHFYLYAKTYWLHHIFYASGQEMTIFNLSARVIETRELIANLTDEDYRTGFIWAAENGNEAIVKLLIDANEVNADLKNLGEQTLLWAANQGHEAVVKMLIDTGQVDVDTKDRPNEETPLFCAAYNGHHAVVKLLLDTDKVDVDSKNLYGQRPLWSAIKHGHGAVVKLLLDTGKVDLNLKDQFGSTLLCWVAAKGYEAIVKLLLNTGQVDINLKDTLGDTPLWGAVMNGHEAIVKLLLDTGQVDINLKDIMGDTPLSGAAKLGHEAIVKLLLSREELDINSANHRGQTPLSWAVRNGHEVVVRLLLDTGKVDINVKDQDGNTPLSLAVQDGHEAIIKMLGTGKVGIDLTDQGDSPK